MAIAVAQLATAFVSIKEGSFYVDNKPFVFVGINAKLHQVTSSSLQDMAEMGFNALRVKVSSAAELKALLKLARKGKFRVLVAIGEEGNVSWIEKFLKNREIIAWEVATLEQAEIINKLDANHLICVAAPSSRVITSTPSQNRLERSSVVDFLTLQLRPVDYGWVAPTNLFQGLKNAFFHTNTYVAELYRRASFNGKPLVVTACCYPRDKMFRREGTPTYNRDSYFSAVFSLMKSDSGAAPTLAASFLSDWAVEAEITDSTARSVATTTIYATDSTTMQIIKAVSK